MNGRELTDKSADPSVQADEEAVMQAFLTMPPQVAS